MRLSTFVLLSLLAAGCLCQNVTQAQTDLVERAKSFPPQANNVDASKLALASIKWKLELKQDLMERFLVREEQASREARERLNQLEALIDQQPPGVRFVDESVRSRLIGKVMEELLDARLDLAARESTVKQLVVLLAEGKQSKQADLLKRQANMAIEAARMKADVAEAEYKKTQQLAEKGATSSRDNMMAKYTMGIARIELQSAELEFELSSEQHNSEIAQQLAEVRIEIEPIRARIEAAEKYLSQFVESANLSARIEEVQRRIEAKRRDVRVLSEESLQLNQEVEELRVLKSRIEAGLKKARSEKDVKLKNQEN